MATRGASWSLLLRQLAAHRGYVVRRAVAESFALGLARAGRVVPGAAAAAAWLHPASSQAWRARAERLERSGDSDAAQESRSRAETLERNSVETSVLPTLRSAARAFGRRRARGGSSDPIADFCNEGRLEQAAAAARALDTPVARSAALLQVAAAEEPERAAELLEEALGFDSGIGATWRALGACRLAGGDATSAIVAFERALALDPADTDALGGWVRAGREHQQERARELAWRHLRLAPGDDAALLAVEALEGGAVSVAASELALHVEGSPALPLRPGARFDLQVETRGAAALYVLEPFGESLRCEPRGRIPLEPGSGVVKIAVEAKRGAAPGEAGFDFRLHLAACDGEQVARRTLELPVADPEAPRVHYIVTEDHELYDERERLTPEEARITLVEKSALAERIANQQGARWTHVVDVASLWLVDWAATRSERGAWSEVARACREHLVDAVAAGNDLALHYHGFRDPEAPGFVHGFDRGDDTVTAPPRFLACSADERGFWSRAFRAIGDVDVPGTRAWATWRGIGLLESLGRLGDPCYRVALFRAGSFDFGDDAAERAASLSLLQRLGILADSDVPKPRFYHRIPSSTVYPVADDPRSPSEPARARLLEIRPEFNIEADFLSDAAVLNRYVDRRMAALEDRPGVHVVCAMTHDKLINWRMGRRWDSLDPGYGDWETIRSHLAHVRQAHPAIRFSTAREAVLDAVDRWTPELVAWRDEEIVVLSEEGEETETFRYSIRLLGRGLEVSAGRPRRVHVVLPAWLEGRVEDAWIERAGQRVPSQQLPGGPARLAYDVGDREQREELVVRARAGDGIRARPAAGGRLALASAHGYRRASVEVPGALAPDGCARRLRGVAFSAGDGCFTASLELAGRPG